MTVLNSILFLFWRDSLKLAGEKENCKEENEKSSCDTHQSNIALRKKLI